MKNITFSADESTIEAARRRAREEKTTLNEAFRLWLANYSRSARQAQSAINVIRDLQRPVATGGQRFTRVQANER